MDCCGKKEILAQIALEEKNEAVTSVQSLVRGHKVRRGNARQEQELKDASGAKITTVARGFLGRVKSKRIQRALQQSRADSGATINRVSRGFIGRKKAGKLQLEKIALKQKSTREEIKVQKQKISSARHEIKAIIRELKEIQETLVKYSELKMPPSSYEKEINYMRELESSKQGLLREIEESQQGIFALQADVKSLQMKSYSYLFGEDTEDADESDTSSQSRGSAEDSLTSLSGQGGRNSTSSSVSTQERYSVNSGSQQGGRKSTSSSVSTQERYSVNSGSQQGGRKSTSSSVSTQERYSVNSGSQQAGGRDSDRLSSESFTGLSTPRGDNLQEEVHSLNSQEAATLSASASASATTNTTTAPAPIPMMVHAATYPRSWSGGIEASKAIERYSANQPKKADDAKLHFFQLHSQVKVLGFINYMKSVLINPTDHSRKVVNNAKKLEKCFTEKIGKYPQIFLLQFQKLVQREMGVYQLKAGETEFYNQIRLSDGSQDSSRGFVSPEVRQILLANAGGSTTVGKLYEIIASLEFAKKMKKPEKAAAFGKLQDDLKMIPGVNQMRVAAEIKRGIDPRAIATSVLVEYMLNN